MSDLPLQLLIAALTALPFLLFYWMARFGARRRLAAAFRRPRPWQAGTLSAWVERGWLDPELAAALPHQLEPARVFYEWAWVDPEILRCWRFRRPVTEETPCETLVQEAWENLPEEIQTAGREALAEAVVMAGSWWGGAERGWNRRPLALLASDMTNKQQGLPLLPVEDLTAAPLPGPLRVEVLAREAGGPALILALAALRAAPARFAHPLAPKSDPAGSLVTGLSARVATDLGRRVGGGLGAVLGPIGAMIGQYLGGMAGSLGGQALARQTLPEAVSAALGEAEEALARLGQLVNSEAFVSAAALPAERVLELGKRLERVREARARQWRERVWPTTGLALVEETLRAAVGELTSYRSATAYFLAAARQAPEAVAGGMILQNPWLVPSLPGGVERLNAARAALNRAAAVIHRG